MEDLPVVALETAKAATSKRLILTGLIGEDMKQTTVRDSDNFVMY